MTEDAQLLSRYAGEQSESAFAELTRRHVDLVYSAALRQVHNDVHSAQDVTQQVFTEAARQAKRLASHPALVGWLYTTTRLMAMRMNRTEQRRKAREQEANAMNQLLHDDAPPADWDQLRPVIEEAMHELDEKDRHAVLLRYFQNKSLHEVGEELNSTENAARMRVERALDKLRGKLAKRGVTTTAAALAAVVSANAVHAAPAGFAASISAAAISGSAIHTSTLIAATKTIAMTTAQKTIIAAALAAAVGTGIYTVHHSAQLNAQIQMLQKEQAPMITQMQELEQDRTLASNQVAALTEENARLKSGRNATELLKLRGEVGTLRQRAASKETNATQAGGLVQMLNDPSMKEFVRQATMEKMKSMYSDLIKELKLTPEQTDRFLQTLGTATTKSLAQMSGKPPGPGSQTSMDAWREAGPQLHEVLGDAGIVRFKDFSDELPGRATVTLLNAQLESALTDQQRAGLIQIIKAEPGELTRGILGGPDMAFMGSQADIDNFLQQVAQSNQRILQQAGNILSADQLAALDGVLTKAIDSRKIQGTAFFKKN